MRGAEVVCAKLAINYSLDKSTTATLLDKVMVDVTTSQRQRAFGAGDASSMAEGRVLDRQGGGEHLPKLVKSEDELAYEIVRCLGLTETRLPIESPFLTAYLEVRTGQAIEYASLISSVDTLFRYSLVETGELSGDHIALSFSMHGLTRSLLQPLLSAQSREVDQAAETVFRQSMVKFAEVAKGSPRLTFIRRWFQRAVEVAKSDSLHSISAYYEHIYYASFYSGFITRGHCAGLFCI